MKKMIEPLGYVLGVSFALAITGLAFAGPVFAANASDAGASSGHDQAAHGHVHEDKKSVSKGYFADEEIKARLLSDWEGDWQSVYPYLVDGTLDPVMTEKAEHGNKSVEEYRAYYTAGYRTDVDRITIKGNEVSFYHGKNVVRGNYEADGHEILTYEKGNRGVRFIFKKVDGDGDAPDFIQFSDHIIAPQKAGHYHLYWGHDRAALLNELTNWPTYYPSDLNGEQIVDEMLAH